MTLLNPPLTLDGPVVDDTYDIAYLTSYLGKLDTGIAFTDRVYLEGLSRSAYSTLVLGNGVPARYPGDGLTYTSNVAEYRRRDPLLHVVNGLGSFVGHLRGAYLPEHRAAHKVAIMHDEPDAFDFYGTDVWNRTHVRDTLMAAQDRLVFVSQRSKDLWVAEGGLDDVPLHVLPNTCAEEQYISDALAGLGRAEVAARLGLAPDAFHVVVLGTVQRRKAQLDVVEAVRRLRRARPGLVVHLHVVGRPRERDYGDTLQACVAEHGLEGVVHVVGEVNKRRALEYVAAVDALVLASHSEAMPLVLLEAMQLGTPIVATAVGGVDELLGAGYEATVPVGDADAIAAALERLADDSGWAARIAAGSTARYWGEYSNARFQQRFDALLSEMAQAAGLTSAQSGTPTEPVVPADGRAWRAELAERGAPDRVELTLPPEGLLAALDELAPLARLGLGVAEVDAAAGLVVCGPGDGGLMSAQDVRQVVGRPQHEVAYAEHVRAAGRRQARARTLAKVAAEQEVAEARRAGAAGSGVRTPLSRRARRWVGRARRRLTSPPAAPVTPAAAALPPTPVEPAVVLVLNSPMQLMASLSLFDARLAATYPQARLVALVHSTNGAAGFAERLVELCRRTGRFDTVADITAAYGQVYADKPSTVAIERFGSALAEVWGPQPRALVVAGYVSARAQKYLYEVAGPTPVHVYEDGLGSYVPKSIRLHDTGVVDRVGSGDCAVARHIGALTSVDLMLRHVPVPQQYDAPVPRIVFPPVRVGAYRIDYARFASVLGAGGRRFAPDEVLLVAQNFCDHLRPRQTVLAAERAANDQVIEALLAAGHRVVIRPHPRASALTWGERWADDPRVEVWQDEPLLPVEVLLVPGALPAFAVGATSSCLFYLDELTGLPVRRFDDRSMDLLRAHANAEHGWMMDLAAQVLTPLDAPVEAGPSDADRVHDDERALAP